MLWIRVKTVYGTRWALFEGNFPGSGTMHIRGLGSFKATIDDDGIGAGRFVGRFFLTNASPTAFIGGSVLQGLTEAQVIAGGGTLEIFLSDARWVAAGAEFNAIRQDIIDGLVATGVQPDGWNAQRANIPVTAVVRTSDSLVTITLPALTNYAIDVDQNVIVTVPASAIAEWNLPVLVDLFSIELSAEDELAPTVALGGTAADDMTEAQAVAGGETLTITLTDGIWVASGATFDAVRQDILDGLVSAGSEVAGWNAQTIDVTAVVRTSDTVVTVTLPALAGYQITAKELVFVTVPPSALDGWNEAIAAGVFGITPNLAPSVGFPVVTRTEYTATSGTTHNVPIAYSAGDIIIIDVAVTLTVAINSFPSGFEVLQNVLVGSARRHALCAARALTDGSGNATFTLGSSAAMRAHVLRVSGGWSDVNSTANPTDALISAQQGGASTTPNPPNLPFGWEAKSLVFASFTPATADTNPTYPTDYTNGDNQSGVIATAWKEVEGTSEDPGTFVQANNVGWSAFTYAVRGGEIEAVFPIVTRTTYSASTATVHPVPIEYTKGDIIILDVGASTSGGFPEFSTIPSGFTELQNVAITTRRHGLYAARAVGSGSGDATFILSHANYFRALVHRVRGAYNPNGPADPTDVIVSAAAVGTSATPDPPSLPAFGWDGPTTVFASESPSQFQTPSGYPATYTNGGHQSGIVGSAWLDVDGAAADPGAFALPSSTEWSAFTYAVRGSGAAPVEEETPPLLPAGAFGVGHFAQGTAPTDALMGFSNPLVTWNAIEPTKGNYNWDAVSSRLEAAASAGKKAIFRVWANATFFAKAVPDFVFDDGALRWTRTSGSRSEDVCVPWDPVYQEHWRDFMLAFGEQFNGDPRMLALQTMSGGSYGEWILGSSTKPTSPTVPAYSHQRFTDAIRWHLDLAREAFPTTPLITTSNGYSGSTGTPPNYTRYELPLLDHAWYDLGYWMGNYNGGGTPQPWLRNKINELSQFTYVFLERENNGRTATLATGFEANMDLHFSQYTNIDMITIHGNAFANSATRARIQDLVIDRLRQGGPPGA